MNNNLKPSPESKGMKSHAPFIRQMMNEHHKPVEFSRKLKPKTAVIDAENTKNIKLRDLRGGGLKEVKYLREQVKEMMPVKELFPDREETKKLVAEEAKKNIPRQNASLTKVPFDLPIKIMEERPSSPNEKSLLFRLSLENKRLSKVLLLSLLSRKMNCLRNIGEERRPN